jgi:hypothetical protein
MHAQCSTASARILPHPARASFPARARRRWSVSPDVIVAHLATKERARVESLFDRLLGLTQAGRSEWRRR